MVYGAIKLHRQGQTLRDSCKFIRMTFVKVILVFFIQNNSFISPFNVAFSIAQVNPLKTCFDTPKFFVRICKGYFMFSNKKL